MKFYIASKLDNHKQVRHLAQLLKTADWTHTYDWTALNPTQELDTETLKAIAINERNGIIQADLVIILTPEGKGTHTELGMAIALNKLIYLCHQDNTYFKCDDHTSSFYWLPEVNHLTGTTEHIASELLKLH